MPFYTLAISGVIILLIDLFTGNSMVLTRNIFLLWIALGLWKD